MVLGNANFATNPVGLEPIGCTLASAGSVPVSLAEMASFFAEGMGDTTATLAGPGEPSSLLLVLGKLLVLE